MRPHEFHDAAGAVPIFGMIVLLIVLLALATGFYLWRQGKLVLPAFGRPSVEDDAKRILAERFARGDIDSDEFMERASILNWTPGSETHPAVRRRRRPSR